MRELTKEWLEYAEHDLYSAHLLSESSRPPFEVIAYHCQQSAEKSLKAILIENGIPLPKTHDLGILCELVSLSYSDILNCLEDCDRLTPYGIVSRYPGSMLSIDKTHVNQALNIAEKKRESSTFILQISLQAMSNYYPKYIL